MPCENPSLKPSNAILSDFWSFCKVKVPYDLLCSKVEKKGHSAGLRTFFEIELCALCLA